MSTVAVQQPSHSSPLRPRDSDPALRTPKTAALRNAAAEMRRSMSSGASARAAGNNASRSPSGERPGRNQQAGSSNGSKSPGTGSSSHPSKQNNSSNPNSSPNVPVIKKEHPSSPENPTHLPASSTTMPPSRHRPRKLDLTRNKSVPQGASTVGARPSTKDSAGLNVMHDVGIACLSPGFQSQDPGIQAQLQKSMDIREHQRRIIESQMHGKSTGGEKSAAESGPPATAFGKPPGTSRRKGPPPGLAIHAPSASAFANEPRVIQSAPLNQTFTGLHSKQGSSLSRQVLDRQPPNADSHRLAQAPASQSSNRLPPISDVLTGEGLGSARGPASGFHAPHSTYSPAHPGASAPMGSPGFPPPPASAGLQPPRSHPGSQPQHPSSREGYGPPRHRDFKSAEDAVQTLSGGREDLQPKLVHYGGHQPPTTPSPRHGENKAPPTSQPQYAPRSGSGRRRTREEYERDLPEADRMEIDNREHEWERRRAAAIHGERRYAAWEEERRGRPPHPTGPFGHRIDSPDTNRRKKDEFMALCARAWDLLHS